jgi:hypothetical protein
MPLFGAAAGRLSVEPKRPFFTHHQTGRTTMRRECPAILVLLFLCVPAASAQTAATSLVGLPALLPADARVDVTLVSGQQLHGRVDAVEATRLSIRDGDAIRWLAESEIARMDRRVPDSIANGLLIGAAVGAGLFVNYHQENALCQVNCQFVSGALALVGIGAAIGGTIDAFMVRTRRVYERADRSPVGQMRFAVALSTRTIAVRVIVGDSGYGGR